MQPKQNKVLKHKRYSQGRLNRVLNIDVTPIGHNVIIKNRFTVEVITQFQGNNLIQINLGPQHPSTHGVLRIIAFVECETIKSVEGDLGLLHRGSEKLIEYRSINKSLPQFNRLDYVSLLAQEEIQSQASEKLLNLRMTTTGSGLRTTMVEISRILNHLLAITTHAIDIGGFTAFL